MNVLILTNGEYGDYTFCEEDYQKNHYDFVICADHGMKHAIKLGIKPDLIVGDFDSGSPKDLEYYRSQGIVVEVFSPMKDETDTELAIQRAVEKGATHITVYGGIGTRLDHSLANVHLLYYLLTKDIKGRLMNPNNVVYLTNKEIILKGNKDDLVSLIPFTAEVKGITTQNLGYPLKCENLAMGISRGISNYMTDSKAVITIEEGILIVIKAID